MQTANHAKYAEKKTRRKHDSRAWNCVTGCTEQRKLFHCVAFSGGPRISDFFSCTARLKKSNLRCPYR
ncbi:MAG: hypothetical protein DME18_08995 [Verrucomicrobia bacterium]|nr:MAG: hypothetical protein DME18_08995 [Verrucomicrobiota bacterium]